MAPARRVRGIKPRESLSENARRVVLVRLDELLQRRGSLEDPGLVIELHDMRIAAKRLRYALEMFAPCFPQTKPTLKDLTVLQDALGDIHDLDVLVGILQRRLQAVDRAYEDAAVAIMRDEGDPAEKRSALRRSLSAQGRDRRRLGLIELTGEKIVERERQFLRARERWGGAGLEELAARVRGGLQLPDAGVDVGAGAADEHEMAELQPAGHDGPAGLP